MVGGGGGSEPRVVHAFDPASYDRLVGAAAVEQQWRRRFERSARPEEREVYDAALESLAVSVDVLSAAADDIAAGLTATAESARAAASRRQALFVALGVAALLLIVALMALLQRWPRPPSERVVVSGRNTHDGRYVLAVVDAGMGTAPDRLAEANARIADPPVRDFACRASSASTSWAG